MCLSQVSERFHSISLCPEGVGEKETRQSNLGWTSETVNVNTCRSEKDTRNESSLRKFMNVSDMQVPDEDDHHDEQCRSNTIKANNKIVKERL